MDSAAYKLLGLCARATCTAEQRDQLARTAAAYSNWHTLPRYAESHGLAPLLYHHLKQTDVEIPASVRRQLQGLFLRHRRASHLRNQVLEKILQIYQSEKVEALILKGAALAHMLYSEPGLRPMSDIDILTNPADVQRARALLVAAGFPPTPSTPSALLHRHLPIASTQIDGLAVQVEIHHKLYSNYWDSLIANLGGRWRGRNTGTSSRAAAATIALFARSRPFAIADTSARTLGHADMLKHLCLHMLSHVNVWDYCRLIWMADLVSYVERFAAEIDWAYIHRRQPAIIHTLSLLHFTTPLSEAVIQQAKLKLGRQPPGLGDDFRGWPQTRPSPSFRQLITDTLLPSEWWLRLRYELGSTRSVAVARYVRHPLHIAGQMVRALLEYLGWPRAVELAGQVGAFSTSGENHET